jgi:hypothetical protein
VLPANGEDRKDSGGNAAANPYSVTDVLGTIAQSTELCGIDGYSQTGAGYQRRGIWPADRPITAALERRPQIRQLASLIREFRNYAVHIQDCV